MEFKFVLFYLASYAFTAVYSDITRAEEKEVDDLIDALQAEESSHWNAPPVSPHVNVLPYDAARQNFFGSVGFQKPASTLSINTGGLIAGQTEILRLLEAFLQLKGKIIAHLYALYISNYDLIRNVANILVDKAPQIQAFALTGIHVLRTILQFALSAFSQWTIALPPIGLQASVNSGVQPHETYGVPAFNVASFLEHTNQ